MFDGAYRFFKSSHEFLFDNAYQRKVVNYVFNTDADVRYLVRIEVYDQNLYMIKFYRKRDKNNKQKYHLLTGGGRFSRIVATCFAIMMDVAKGDAMASFGFIGTNTLNKEEKEETGRFRLYRYAVAVLVAYGSYDFYEDPVQSSFFLINHKKENTANFYAQVKLILNEVLDSL